MFSLQLCQTSLIPGYSFCLSPSHDVPLCRAWLHLLDTLVLEGLLLDAPEATSSPSRTSPLPPVTPHKASAPAPDHLDGPLLHLLQFISFLHLPMLNSINFLSAHSLLQHCLNCCKQPHSHRPWFSWGTSTTLTSAGKTIQLGRRNPGGSYRASMITF